jgi:hypothetical protein
VDHDLPLELEAVPPIGIDGLCLLEKRIRLGYPSLERQRVAQCEQAESLEVGPGVLPGEFDAPAQGGFGLLEGADEQTTPPDSPSERLHQDETVTGHLGRLGHAPPR